MDEAYFAGCMLIDRPGALDVLGGRLKRLGLQVQAFDLAQTGSAPLHDRLREAYYALRSRCGEACIAARGVGAWAALALAAQTPAQRLVLIDPIPADAPYPGMDRQTRRLIRFARDNLPLCVADILVLSGDAGVASRALRRLRRAMPGSIVRAWVPGDFSSNAPFWGGNAVLDALAQFIIHGILPKCLAENAEMCIIEK